MRKILTFLIILIFPLNVYALNKAVVDITNMPISDIQDAFNKGYLTSELLVNLYLDRINTYNNDFNAILYVNENALEEAKYLDELRTNGTILGPLHGIPFIVKTNIDVKGIPTTAGAKALSDNYPNSDAQVIEELKKAGAIVLATSNMSEFAFSASKSQSSFGQVKNAYNPLYTPYGSSGGSATALALSFATFALGTDTNSSVRLPSAGAGLVGLRPTFNKISTKGVIPYDINRDTVGIMSKTVADNHLIYETITKEETTSDLDNLKIGYIRDFVEGSSNKSGINSLTDPDIKDLTYQKIDLLKESGLEVVEIPSLLNSTYQSISLNTKTGASFCDGFNAYIQNTTGSIRSFKDLANSSKKIYSLNAYLSSCNNAWDYDQQSLEKFEQHVLEVMQENNVNVLIYPTLKQKVYSLKDSPDLASPSSYLPSPIGYPALTVPMGQIGEFYYGLEFFTTKDNEELLYQVAEIFSQNNKLPLSNSPLAPSLYEIPSEVLELKALYEKNLNNKELTSKTKSFFLNYNNLTLEEINNQTISLIEEYHSLNILKNNYLELITLTILIYIPLLILIKKIK